MHRYAQVTSVRCWTLADKQDGNMSDSKQSSKTVQERSLLQWPETEHLEVNTLKLTLQSLRGHSRNDPTVYSLYKSEGKKKTIDGPSILQLADEDYPPRSP